MVRAPAFPRDDPFPEIPDICGKTGRAALQITRSALTPLCALPGGSVAAQAAVSSGKPGLGCKFGG